MRILWQVFVLRNLNNLEIEKYERLLNTFSSVNLDGSIDTPKWCFANNRFFTVKSFYKHLFRYEDKDIRFPIQQIWKAKVPPHTSSCASETSRSCILTIDNLSKRGKIFR